MFSCLFTLSLWMSSFHLFKFHTDFLSDQIFKIIFFYCFLPSCFVYFQTFLNVNMNLFGFFIGFCFSAFLLLGNIPFPVFFFNYYLISFDEVKYFALLNPSWTFISPTHLSFMVSVIHFCFSRSLLNWDETNVLICLNIWFCFLFLNLFVFGQKV